MKPHIEAAINEELLARVRKHNLEDFIESGAPADEYIDEHGSVPNKDALMALLDLDHVLAGTDYRKLQNFPPGQDSIIEVGEGEWGNERATNIFLEARDGSWEREKPEDLLERIDFRDDESDYLGVDLDEQFNEEFWSSPSTLYHGTSDCEGVLRDGIEARRQSRGNYNTSVGSAVFTSLSTEVPEAYADGDEGCVIEIDTEAMKERGFTPRVTQEPAFVKYEALGSIAHKLKVADDWPNPYEGAGVELDPDTVIVYSDIPPKYLSNYWLTSESRRAPSRRRCP